MNRNQKRQDTDEMEDYNRLFRIMNELTDQYPGGLDEPFPISWEDPLELYGCYRRALEALVPDLDQERDVVRELMSADHYSPSTIWHARLNLVAQRLCSLN